MEAGEIAYDYNLENTIGASYTLLNPALYPDKTECFDSPRFESNPASSAKKRKVGANSPDSQEKDTTPSVSNCYVFKSRLQEYCQKAGVTTPVYETIKEGPSHEPYFRSTVIVNNVRYDSLPGFFNRKAAEQSAAEVALVELGNSADMKFGIAQPVQETGLCKNLLQEYAQKMNYAIPLYECHKEEKGQMSKYYCVVEIGSIKYIGASASTKKEAEIKAARTAMLAIQSSGDDQTVNSIYTVVPQKKKAPDFGIIAQEKAKVASKSKKKRRLNKRKGFKKRNSSGEGTIGAEVKMDCQVVINGLGSEANTCSSGVVITNVENKLVSDVNNVL
ncbi:hypothetical protein CASFOL_037446 [Castilleja foliolosa]|uniref:DRBM domain-containing protein n=1 Tax=Castilleja foliolosa TaxID=1961234 RepID=A0ABD3BNK4_9LAMI